MQRHSGATSPPHDDAAAARYIDVVVFWLLAIPGFVGLALLIRGWRGRRVDDHPLCRRCHYDLVASVQAVNCPECGSDLSRPRAVRIGHRRKRWPSLALGGVLLAAALGSGGVFGYAIAKGANLNPYKPLWMLKKEANAAQPSATSTAANREILARLTAGTLSDSQITGIVQPALAVQADPNILWHTWWGDFIEQAWLAGKVADDVIIQYAKNAIATGYELQMPRKMRQGGMVWVYQAHEAKRAGSTGAITAEVRHGPVKLQDGRELGGGRGVSRSSLSAGSSGRGGSGMTMSLPVGKHTAVMESTVRIGRVPQFQAMVFGDAVAENDDTWVMAEWPMQMQAEFEVVPPDEEIVEKVADASLEQAIRKPTLIAVRVMDMRAAGTRLDSRIDFDALPMDVAFEVFVRIGEREWPAGTAAHEKAGVGMAALPRISMGDMMQRVRDFPADAMEADVVLRASTRVAEEAGLDRIWDGEIVFPNVPLERPFRNR